MAASRQFELRVRVESSSLSLSWEPPKAEEFWGEG